MPDVEKKKAGMTPQGQQTAVETAVFSPVYEHIVPQYWRSNPKKRMLNPQK